MTGQVRRCCLAVVLALLSVACHRGGPRQGAGGGGGGGGDEARREACEGRKAEGSAKVDACYAEAAAERLAPELCDPIAADGKKASCQNDVARALGRPDLCSKDDAGNACLSAVAKELLDVSLCDGITSTSNRTGCVHEIAVALKSFDTCSKSAVPEARAMCEREVAQLWRDPKLCDRIEPGPSRDECFKSIDETAETPGALCERIQDPHRRDGCYGRAAWYDPALCERVGIAASSSERTGCYGSAFTLLVPRPETCEKVPAEGADDCFAKLGEARHTGSFCRKVKDSHQRDRCWSFVAGLDNPGACYEISLPEDRAQCARGFWRTSEDPKICSLLTARERPECERAMKMVQAL
jgi:hypothetical protein